MNDSRPINLDIIKMHLPVTAWASILHRVSAVIIWVGFGFLLYAVCASSGSAEDFAAFTTMIANSFFMQFMVWGFLTALAYYCAGTIKHIIQDFGYFEDFAGGKIISWTAILLGILLSVLVGAVIWA